MERWSLNEAPSWSCPPLAIANQYHDQRSQPQNVRYRLILVRASDFDWLQKDQHYLRHLHQIAAGHNWIPVQNLPFDELILFAYAADRTPDLRMYWGGPPLGVQNLYTFPTPKTSIKQIEQFNMSPGLRKKAQDAQDAVLRFLKFSVSVALTRRLRFLRFLRFSVYYAIYKMNRGFEIFEVFSFNRTDKAFEIFLSNGDSGYYNTIRRGPQAGGHQGPAIIPPKALRILVRICSQVPAKVQSALLHALGV